MSSKLLDPDILLVPTEVYFYRGVYWVPHYTRRGVYVAPGSVETWAKYLDERGAEKRTLDLWMRRHKS